MTRDEKWEKDEAAIRELVKKHDGVVKTSELYTLGIDYRRIQSFVDWGVLLRVKNGYYSLQEQKLSEDEMVYRLFGEDGVLTMESALYIYGYLPTKPAEYQIARSNFFLLRGGCGDMMFCSKKILYTNIQ